MKLSVAIVFLWPILTATQDWTTPLNQIYGDESHCLTATEIKSDQDAPISCYCRDAIATARYVWFAYMLARKDPNMADVESELEDSATDTCGEDYNVVEAINRRDWKWSGPEVLRHYPSREEINHIMSDQTGWRRIPYMFQLIRRDSRGAIISSESRTAWYVDK